MTESMVQKLLDSVSLACATFQAEVAASRQTTELLVDSTEAARLLGMSVSWVVKQTNLPFKRRIGRSVRYSLSGINKWLETRPR